MKKEMFALTLDDYATVSFCSFSKCYFGTMDDLIPFMEAIEKDNKKPDMVAAFKDFVLGNKTATHKVAYCDQRLLEPVVYHEGVKQVYTDRSWTYKNIYGFPYEMHADRIEVEQIAVKYDETYHRCMKAKFTNLAYEDELAETKYNLIKKFWGHPHLYKTDFRSKANYIIESRFFVTEDGYDSLKVARERMAEQYISFDSLMNDIFGDG